MERLLTALKAAGESTRLRILALLARGELTVSELVRVLRQSQPRVSRHLKLLAEAGLVERLQEGAWAFYRLVDRADGGRIARQLISFVRDDDPSLMTDLERLAEIKAERQAAAHEFFRAHAKDWDKIRSLHIPERKVERAVLEATKNTKIEDLLDVGTGTGRMLELFAGRIRRGIGIDLSREMLNIARAKLDGAGLSHCHVRLGDMYALGLPDDSFDAVIFHQVLHFAHRPAAAIAEAARVLRENAILLIVDFAPHGLEFLREQQAHRRLGFAEQEVDAWCTDAGLKCSLVKQLPGKELTVNIWKAHKVRADLSNAA